MTTRLPEWIANVPMKTVGVLCATHIFGKNIESRQIVLAGKRYFHNAVENVVGYVLNPILPDLTPPSPEQTVCSNDAAVALQNIRDCFNYIFHIQVEYSRILSRLMARHSRKPQDEYVGMIRDNLLETCRRLERFTIDMLRMNVFSIVKHDLDKIGGENIDAVIKVRARDDGYAGRYGFDAHCRDYADTLYRLYENIGFKSGSMVRERVA